MVRSNRGSSVQSTMPLVWLSTSRTVIASPFGTTPGRYFPIGSSSPTRPSAESWSSTVATKVLVTLPTRIRPSATAGSPVPRSLTPAAPGGRLAGRREVSQ